jgi:cytochrome c oxidase subunit IV
MDNHPAPHSSVKIYLTVFAGLALLTGLTVLLSYMSLPHHVAIVLAVLIAVTKCTLIMAFFMHLRFEPKTILALFFTALFFVVFLALFLLPDIAFTTK